VESGRVVLIAMVGRVEDEVELFGDAVPAWMMSLHQCWPEPMTVVHHDDHLPSTILS